MISNESLKEYIVGAVCYDEYDGLIPYRFTEQKRRRESDKINKIRHYTASGIKIDFYSDTEMLSFKYTAFTRFSSEMYTLYFFDIYVDNVLVLHQGEKNLTEDADGIISLKLKKGLKRITIYLPGSCAVKISDFCIDEWASMKKIEYDKKVIFFGDSITHAAYIDFPSLTYVNIIAGKMNYNILNQGIGGAIFDKKNLMDLSSFKPDIIYVAYGTNDWGASNENCAETVNEYFSELIKLYSEAEINVILPIWRKDTEDHPQLRNSFYDIRDTIKNVAEKYGFNIVDAIDFIPRSKQLYWDGYLHPNEMGFLFYADSLEEWIHEKVLPKKQP